MKMKSKVQSPESKVQPAATARCDRREAQRARPAAPERERGGQRGESPKSSVQGSGFEVQGSTVLPVSADRHPAAVGYLSRFLSVGFALALLATGCTGPRPLKGGRAVTTHKPAGVIEQTLVQG